MHDNKWHWAIGAVVALVGLIVAAAVVLFVYAPPETDPMIVLTLLVGVVSPTVIALLALLKGLENGREMEENTRATTLTAHGIAELANGGLDSKVRAAVADVLKDDAIDPDVRPQLTLDYAKRSELAEWAAQSLLAERLREDDGV